jgi:lysophospholipase L1-like esterase
MSRGVAYSLAAMDAATTAGRPRRSRAGLFLFLLLLALASWEVVGRMTPAVKLTPLRFGQAAWAVASGHGGGIAPPGAPSAEELARNAYRPLPYVMYGLKPDWKRPAPPEDPSLVRTTNRLGFRGGQVDVPKPAGRYRVICLGGSTTYCESISDDAAYPHQLEQALRAARPGKDIEVVNGGVPSYTTAETLASLAFRCLDLQPDAIVLYEGINDYRPREYRNFTPDYFHFRKIWDGSAAHYEAGEGDLAAGINTLIQNNFPDGNGDKVQNAQKAGTAAFRRNLASIAGIAKAHGIKVVLVSCACDPEQSPPGLAEGIAQHNEVVREVAAQQGATFVDMAAKFQRDGQFVDAVHVNPEGAQQMARIIADGMLAGIP